MRLRAGFGWLWGSPSGADWRPGGFPLLAAGALAGLVGVAAVLFAQSVEPWNMQRYAYREIAGAALGLALPLFLGGVATALPLSRVAKASVVVGGALCLVGAAAFVWLYPFFWNVEGRDYSPWGIVPYGAGLAWLGAALTSGLVASYVEARARRTLDVDEDVSEEEVLRDLEDAARRSRLTWGGVHVDDRELLLSPQAVPEGVLHGRVVLRESVDDAALPTDVGTLLAFRGAKERDAEDYDDSPVSALARLREEQNARPPTLAQRLATWWARVALWWRRVTT